MFRPSKVMLITGAVPPLLFTAPASADVFTSGEATVKLSNVMTAKGGNTVRIVIPGTGTIECEEFAGHAEVVFNEGPGEAEGPITTKNCVDNAGGGTLIPTTISEASANVSLNGTSTGSASATFKANIGGSLICFYSSNSLGITYTPTTDVLKVSGRVNSTRPGLPPVGHPQWGIHTGGRRQNSGDGALTRRHRTI